MMRTISAAVLVLGFSVVFSSAQAHPGSAILTAGGADERSAMTEGMSYEDVNGVHVFRGTAAIIGAETMHAEKTMHREVRIKLITHKSKWRSFRSLRTQGFYSGAGPKSRQFTKGFYSGR